MDLFMDEIKEPLQENQPSAETDITPEEECETDTAVTEEEWKAQYEKLPMWQHLILVILCLFGMTAVIMLINFVVDLGAELLRRML